MVLTGNTDFDLVEQKALSILETYEGANNYILKLKNNKLSNPKYVPTRAQSEYIYYFHTRVPKIAKKWVELDPYFAGKLAEEKMLSTIPDNVWVEKLLVEKEKSYHIWGKFFSGQTLSDFWLPKTALIKGTTVGEIKIDYSKYSHRPPLDHQKEAIEKLVGSKRFILADDMGLGKTTATIIAALETNAKRVLIVCPASLKINWLREIQNYTNKSVYISEGKNFCDESDFVIVNYDILKNFHSTSKNEESKILGKFDLVILDEAHMISNVQAQRTKLVNSFAKRVERLWLLSGTPMTSRPINYYNLLNLIDSPVAQNWRAYVIRYCEGYQFKLPNGKKIWNTSGAKNLEELRTRTSKQVLRRLKEDVLDLPEKIITPVYLRLKSKLYEELMGEYYDWYDNKKEESGSLTLQFSKLTKVRQIIAEEKINSTIEMCENILEQGKKVIVFTNFTDTLRKIHSHFGKQAVYLDGSCSKVDRQKAVDDFQNNEKIKVFVGNLKAAGVGLTLTSGEVVVMNDLSFVPSDHSQAEDRAYRYGQKNNVLIYYPIFENSIEGVVYDILNRKKNIFETVMGDNLSKGDFIEDILTLINSKR